MRSREQRLLSRSGFPPVPAIFYSYNNFFNLLLLLTPRRIAGSAPTRIVNWGTSNKCNRWRVDVKENRNLKLISAKKTLFSISRIIFFIVLITLIPATWILWQKLEGERPVVSWDLPQFITPDNTHTIDISDKKSGIRSVQVFLIQQTKEVMLVDQMIEPAIVHDLSVPLKIDARKHRLADGAATVRIVVRDMSWNRWFHGNKTETARDVTIDSKPPGISVLTRFHNINQGGAGLVIYRLSEPCSFHGVQVGEKIFQGQSGLFKDPAIMACLIALDYRQGPGTELFVLARDMAENASRSGFPVHILKKTFKTDSIRITDEFLNQNLSGFNIETDSNTPNPQLDRFLKINREYRTTNTRQLLTFNEDSSPAILWERGFLRMPNAAPRAGFADHRIYLYQEKEIDRQVHLGVDLASVRQAPIPAANTGHVIKTEDIGIYGNTVVIDHGLGLFSMYSHLSRFSVQPGQSVKKGDIIGYTGMTGLAAGDHLHFAMAIRDVFVNPIEWWDESWIKNNITSKIQDVHLLTP